MLNIVVLPFAGSSASAVTHFNHEFLSQHNIVGLEYPGRGTRWREPLVENINELLADLETQLVKAMTNDGPIVLVGFSFGAYLAYVLTLTMGKKADILGLCAVSSFAPDALTSELFSRLEDDAKLLEHVTKLGGIPQEVLNSKALMELTLAVVKADFRCYSQFKVFAQKLDCPVAAIYGKSDPIVTRDSVNSWPKRTNYQGQLNTCSAIEGGHFLHKTNALETVIADWITNLEQVIV